MFTPVFRLQKHVSIFVEVRWYCTNRRLPVFRHGKNLESISVVERNSRDVEMSRCRGERMSDEIPR